MGIITTPITTVELRLKPILFGKYLLMSFFLSVSQMRFLVSLLVCRLSLFFSSSLGVNNAVKVAWGYWQVSLRGQLISHFLSKKGWRGQRLKFKLEKLFRLPTFPNYQVQIYFLFITQIMNLNIYACIIYIINHIFYRTTKHIQILNVSKNESVEWSGLQTIIGLESHRGTTKIQG